MREITTHKVNGLNDALTIEVRDEPGSGGACHRYDITGFDTDSNPSSTPADGYKSRFTRLVVLFQNGPIKEVGGVNGVSGEALLAIVKDRLECFQSGPYQSSYNQEALDHINCAIEVLHRRTKERVARGVEGTHSK